MDEQLKLCTEFLTELGRGLPDTERVMVGYAAEATVKTESDGRKINKGWWPEPWRLGKYIKETGNAYVSISSSIKTPNEKGEMRFWRGEASFGHGLALMVDDIGDGKGSKGGLSVATVSLMLPPTAVIETSPGNHQLWYFFDEPEANMRRFKSFLVGFVKNVLSERGGASTFRDVSRYGRMPIGINNKRIEATWERKYGEKCPVRLLHANYSNRYSMDDIAKAFKFTIVEPPPPREPTEDEMAEKPVNDYLLACAVALLTKAKMGEASGGKVTKNMSGKYRIKCPWGDEHTNGDRGGAYFRGYIPGAEHEYVFGCAHDTCRKDNKRTWSTFIDFVVMPSIIRALNKANAEHEQYTIG